MKKHLTFTALIIIGSVFFIACKPNTKTSKDSDEKSNPVKETKVQENHFNGLRDMALNVTADQLGIKTQTGEINVFGIVMDWNIGNVVATIAAYQTGDASMYLSSGAAVVGGGQHENVRQAVSPYILMGQDFLDKSLKTDKTPIPDTGCVRFYFLTNKGIFSAQEQMENIENSSSIWLPLFDEANKVLTEIRLTTEHN